MKQMQVYWPNCFSPKLYTDFVSATMALETELKTYEEKLPELLANEGKFVLIHGNTVVGFFVAYEDAVNEGYEKFGLEPFLVKRIQATEQVQFVTRITSCPTSPAL